MCVSNFLPLIQELKIRWTECVAVSRKRGLHTQNTHVCVEVEEDQQLGGRRSIS